MSPTLAVVFWMPFLIALLFTPENINRGKLFHVDDGSSNGILLLTAHPDDECMFFAPTLLQQNYLEVWPENMFESELSRQSLRVHSLCLSVGDADGLGEVRRNELSRSLDVLGVDDSRRWVIDSPDLKDNISTKWDSHIIADTIEPFVLENNITTILTFDGRGISLHPNHISLYHGVSHFLSTLSPESAIKAYALISVPLSSKYLGPIASLQTKIDVGFWRILRLFTFLPQSGSVPEIIVFLSGYEEYWKTLKAMWQHRSQLVWFRGLYVLFSRYMWVNEWTEILPTPVPA